MNEFTFRSSSSPFVTVRRMAEHRCSVLFTWGPVSPFVEGHGGVGPLLLAFDESVIRSWGSHSRNLTESPTGALGMEV